jgi:hypothetical protein
MKRKTVLLRTLGLIVLLLVSIGVSGVHAVSADCTWNCETEEICVIHPGLQGCRQRLGIRQYDMWGNEFCVQNCPDQPCTTNCFK